MLLTHLIILLPHGAAPALHISAPEIQHFQAEAQLLHSTQITSISHFRVKTSTNLLVSGFQYKYSDGNAVYQKLKEGSKAGKKIIPPMKKSYRRLLLR